MDFQFHQESLVTPSFSCGWTSNPIKSGWLVPTVDGLLIPFRVVGYSPLLQIDLQSHQEWLVTSITDLPLFHQWALGTWLVGWLVEQWYGIHKWVRFDDTFSSRSPYSTSQQYVVELARRRLPFLSQLFSLHPEINSIGIFRNKILPCSSGIQPRAATNAWIVLGTSALFLNKEVTYPWNWILITYALWEHLYLARSGTFVYIHTLFTLSVSRFLSAWLFPGILSFSWSPFSQVSPVLNPHDDSSPSQPYPVFPFPFPHVLLSPPCITAPLSFSHGPLCMVLA